MQKLEKNVAVHHVKDRLENRMNWDKIYNKLKHAKKLIDDTPNMPIEKFESALLEAVINLQKAIDMARDKRKTIPLDMKPSDEGGLVQRRQDG